MAQGATFHLVVASVGEQLFDGQAHSANIPTEGGELTILPHHEPLVSTLKAGTIKVRDEAGEKTYRIEGGLLECSNNRAVVIL